MKKIYLLDSRLRGNDGGKKSGNDGGKKSGNDGGKQGMMRKEARK